MSPRILLVLAITVFALMTASVAFAGGEKGPWDFNTGTGLYSGTCTLYSDNTPKSCHAKLVSGSEESETLVIESGNCTITVTTSGRANMRCSALA